MRRFCRVRRASPPKAFVGSFATIATLALLPCGVAAANSTSTSHFDNFALGSVNGQHGWSAGTQHPSEGGQSFDQAVVPVSDYYPSGVPGFGTRAWRFSNAVATTGFANLPHSPELTQPASENGPNTEFIAQFSFITTTPDPQPGLEINISAFDGTLGRMSFLRLDDTSAGTGIQVLDALPDGSFPNRDFSAVLPRGVPHTIKIWIKLHPGLNNDVMAIYVDGKDVGERFTTWENWYHSQGEPTPDINSLLFRANTQVPAVDGGGYLFDNVTTTTDNGAGPPEPDVPVEKLASTRTVRPGGIEHYTITARNTGRAVAQNFLVCDRIPRDETFVSADHMLVQRGSRRCLEINSLAPGQHVSIHLALRVDRSARAGMLDNTTDETEGDNRPLPPDPPLGEVPGHITDPRPAPEGGANVDVVTPSAPTFTG